MKLNKIAHIKIPHNHPTWMKTHLANPIAKVLDTSTIRVYCNVRNQQNQTHIIYLDLNAKNNFSITYFHETPLLTLGPAGAFDDCGQSLGCIVTQNERDYLYYLGWNLANNVPFRNSIGLALSSQDTNEFNKLSLGPIMDRNMIDPFCLSYPFVLEHQGIYKMWYGSHTKTGATVNDVRHSIKYAESSDLVNWHRTDTVCLRASDDEIAFTRPFVMHDEGIYKMWYSYLRNHYRIGYAESNDGKYWIRKDELVGIDVSANEWDSEMIEYPYLFDFEDNRYLIYCGNKFGETGFGVAIFEK